MTDDKRLKLQERMAELHEKYCKKLPEKYQEIENSWNEYKSDLSNADFIETFYRNIHTLKGTAATFGFNAQADICFEIQKLLLDIKDENAILEETSVSQINKHMVNLKKSINTPADDLPD